MSFVYSPPASSSSRVNNVANAGATLNLPSPLQYGETRAILTQNCTINLPRPVAGQQLLLALVQDSTGGRAVTWGATVSFPGAVLPTLTSTPGGIDLIEFFCVDGATWDGQLLGNNFLYWGAPPSSSQFIQSGNTGVGSVASGASFNLTSNVTSGNTVILAITYGGAPGTVTVSGAGITNWSRIERGGQNNGFTAVGYDLWWGTTSSGGSRAITVTNTGGFGYQAFAIEFANVQSISQFVQSCSVGIPNPSCTLQPLNSGQACVVFINAPGSTFSSTPAAPWTDLGSWGNHNGDVAYLVSSGPGAVTATWTPNSTPVGCVGVVLHSQSPKGIVYVGTVFGGTTNGAVNTRTLAITAQTLGDVIVFMTFDNDSNAQTVSSVAGGGVTTWNLMGNYQTPSGPTFTSTVSIWWGIVTATGAQTITATFSGAANDYVTLFAREYALPSGTTTWGMTGFSGTSAVSSPATSLALPTLNVPGSAKWALYVGVCGVTAAGSFIYFGGPGGGPVVTSNFNYWENVDSVGGYVESSAPATGTPTPPSFAGSVGGANGGVFVGAGSILTAS